MGPCMMFPEASTSKTEVAVPVNEVGVVYFVRFNWPVLSNCALVTPLISKVMELEAPAPNSKLDVDSKFLEYILAAPSKVDPILYVLSAENPTDDPKNTPPLNVFDPVKVCVAPKRAIDPLAHWFNIVKLGAK